MTKKYLAAVFITVGLAGAGSTAFAQNWSGPYIGGYVNSTRLPGHDETLTFDANLDGKYGDTVNTAGGVNAFSPGFCDGKPQGATPVDGCRKEDSQVGFGVRVGYDWQGGQWVYGVLAEIASIDLSDSVTGFSTTPAAYTFTREIDSLIAVRGRIGYAYNKYLFYTTAGYAWADIDRTFATTNTLNSFKATDGDDGKGYQVGLGVETHINSRWLLGVEYLHTSLNDDGVVVRAGPSANTFASNPFLIANTMGTDMKRTDNKFENDALVVTVTYRFGGM
ncbi:outer membrane protein [Asticcacaulis sp. 201]|uniref:outer membrane protein n=1 Tax=Asticcacaulis sp. 201 TaxID=3028787 RepID=UPI0029168C25|nr:outer membrane beta-barrel protein [Asticcacaulis sp. 201]MDV6331147.1 outer membrane beta-barrel protein [Asticcacaulis sp. 201]